MMKCLILLIFEVKMMMMQVMLLILWIILDFKNTKAQLKNGNNQKKVVTGIIKDQLMYQ